MSSAADRDPDAGHDAPEYGQDDSQDYVDRSKIDFDPADGLHSGTAVDGTSDIPGADDEPTAEPTEESATDDS